MKPEDVKPEDAKPEDAKPKLSEADRMMNGWTLVKLFTYNHFPKLLLGVVVVIAFVEEDVMSYILYLLFLVVVSRCSHLDQLLHHHPQTPPLERRLQVLRHSRLALHSRAVRRAVLLELEYCDGGWNSDHAEQYGSHDSYVRLRI